MNPETNESVTFSCSETCLVLANIDVFEKVIHTHYDVKSTNSSIGSKVWVLELSQVSGNPLDYFSNQFWGLDSAERKKIVQRRMGVTAQRILHKNTKRKATEIFDNANEEDQEKYINEGINK